MCSHAAAAAEAAELFFMTEMISAPLLATFEIKGPFQKAWSSNCTLRDLPFTVAWCVSGYCVALWFPQMMTFSTSSILDFVLSEIWLIALIWSSLVIAVKFFFGIECIRRISSSNDRPFSLGNTRNNRTRLNRHHEGVLR